MANSFIQIQQDGNGKKVDNSLLSISGHQVYRQRVEVYSGEDLPVFGPVTDEELRATPLVVSGSIDTGLQQGLTDTQLRASPVPIVGKLGWGDLVTDAWGVQKMSLPHSLFHGLFTFDIPPTQWFTYHNGVQVYTSVQTYSNLGEGVIKADATVPNVLLESRYTPRYQPNRGHLYSTALWCPNKTNDGTRDWGLRTTHNGVHFRLKANGLLYAVIRKNTVETEFLIDTSVVPGFDVEKGNVYDIQYQWRGVGNYDFYVNLKLVHTVAYLGTLTSLSLNDPALPAIFAAVRTTQDVEIHAGCVDITSENGDDDRLQYGSVFAEQALNGTTKPLIVIHNPLLINGLTNTRMIELAKITLNADKKTVFKVWTTRNPAAITGATFVARGNGSYVQTDSIDANPTAVPATAVNTSLMTLITSISAQANVTAIANNPFQSRIDYPIVRGDYLVITATVVNGLCDAVVEWGEAI